MNLRRANAADRFKTGRHFFLIFMLLCLWGVCLYYTTLDLAGKDRPLQNSTCEELYNITHMTRSQYYDHKFLSDQLIIYYLENCAGEKNGPVKIQN